MSIDLRDRAGLMLAAAAGVVVTVTAVVIAFGIVPYPDVPTLADEPAPPVTSELAYLAYDREPCLHVVDGTGVDREVLCGTDLEGGDLRWVDEDRLTLRRYRFDEEVVTVDVRTGEVVETRKVPADEPPRPVPALGADTRDDGAQVAASSSGGVATVEVRGADGEVTTVLRLEGPEGYRLEDPRWTGHGDWIVVRDSTGRVLVLGADGEPEPRVWVTDTYDYAVR